MGLRSRRNGGAPVSPLEDEVAENDPYKPPVKPRPTHANLQYIPAYQPTYHPCCAMVIFALLTLFLLPAGVIALTFSSSIPLFEIRYDSYCADALQRDNVADPLGRPLCISAFDFVVPERFEPPVFIQYRVDGVYLNHREFGDSRDDRLNAGFVRDLGKLMRCRPFRQVGEKQDWSEGDDTGYGNVYNPCGGVAWSMFNDSFTLYDTSTGDLVCDTAVPTPTCSKTNIAWDADRYVRYRQDPPFQERYFSWPNEYIEEAGHQIPNVNDEDTMNWMVASPQRDFRKLWRRLEVPLEPGRIYRVVMAQRWDVTTFGGAKYLSFTTTSWVGGRNQVVGIVMLVIGTLTACMVIALGCVWAFGGGSRSGDVMEAIANM